MAKEFRKREDEGNELIKRFEDHLKKRKSDFFDLDAYDFARCLRCATPPRMSSIGVAASAAA